MLFEPSGLALTISTV